jgi:alternate signal-mediated exported protein
MSRYQPRRRRWRRRRPPSAAGGAVASALVALLLIGGDGTSASWRAAGSTTAGSFGTGMLQLVTDATNTGCGAWTFVSSPTSAGAYTGQPLQPGDSLSLTCRYTLQVAGDHLAGTLSVSNGSSTFPAGATLTATAYTLNGASAAAAQTFTSANDGQKAGVTLTLAIPAASTPPAGSSVVLSGVRVTATQARPGA